MLPVLYKFTFNDPLQQGMLYATAVLLVLYMARNGWAGAEREDERVQRAVMYGLFGAGLAAVGLYYALPEVVLWGKGRGEGIPIHTYGVLVGSGFISAVTVAAWGAEREWPGEEGRKKRDMVFDMAFYLFVAGIVGSRVLFIIVNWKDYADRPASMLSLSGGLVFYGGLIAASATAYWYTTKHGMNFLRFADIGMPTVSLGQMLGRMGCFSAGCCWGDIAKPEFGFGVQFPGAMVKNIFGQAADTPSLAYQSQSVDKRWVVEATGQIFHEAVPGSVRISEWVAQHGHTFPVHPTQLYESFGQLVMFAGLMTLRRYKRFHGQIFAIWLMAYAVLRSTVELFRGDVERGTLNGLLNSMRMDGLARAVPLEAWYNISTSQFISLCMFALGATLIVTKLKVLRATPQVDLNAVAVG